MKKIFSLFAVLILWNCNRQDATKSDFILSISPVIDQNNPLNQAIINALSGFLQTKNTSLIENKYWLQEDFQKYTYPYLDIYNIENSGHGFGFYKPTLMEIIETEHEHQMIVKIASIGHHIETQELHINAIFNLIVNLKKEHVAFSRYLDYATNNWQTLEAHHVNYKISPSREINPSEILKQQKDIHKICHFFECDPISITYYSCIHPKEVFEIKGFDYHPMMYVSKTGGLADFGNIVFSGNNSEIYTHEIVHIYTNNLFPDINKFLDEGVATYMAGSGKFEYEWHRKKLGQFLLENNNFDFSAHTDPYERLYFENETSIPYLAAALILERTHRIYGKEKLIELIRSEKELWQALDAVGLTKENLNEELRKELKETPTPAFDPSLPINQLSSTF